jgi:hypothetical protein
MSRLGASQQHLLSLVADPENVSLQTHVPFKHVINRGSIENSEQSLSFKQALGGAQIGVGPERSLFGDSQRHLSEWVAVPKKVSRQIHLPFLQRTNFGCIVNDLQSKESKQPDIVITSKASEADGDLFFSPPAINMFAPETNTAWLICA